MTAPTVSRAEHERLMARCPLSGACHRVMAVIYRLVDWRTGRSKWPLAATRIRACTELALRSVFRCLRRLLGDSWLRSVGRGTRRTPVYVLWLPWWPKDALAEAPEVELEQQAALAPPEPLPAPAPTMLERVGAFARRVVGLAPAAPSEVVPFAGGAGREPTLMLRPTSYGEGARGGEELGGEPNDPRGALGPEEPAGIVARACQGPAPHRGDRGHPRDTGPPAYLDAAADPDEHPGARHVGPLYRSREEARGDEPGVFCARPPPPRTGSGDDGDHARCLLLYRQLMHQARGTQPLMASTDHAALARLIRKKGIDGALDAIRDAFVRYAWRDGLSMQEIAFKYER